MKTLKNLCMLLMSIAFIASMMTAIQSCQKDDEWGSDIILTPTYTVNTEDPLCSVLSLRCSINVSVSQIRPTAMYFTVSKSLNDEGEEHYMAEMEKWSTNSFASRESVKIRLSPESSEKYYIRAYTESKKGTLRSEPTIYDAPMCTELVATTSASNITSNTATVTVTFSKSVTNDDIVYDEEGEIKPAYIIVDGSNVGEPVLYNLPTFSGKTVSISAVNLVPNEEYRIYFTYGSNKKFMESQITYFTTLK